MALILYGSYLCCHSFLWSYVFCLVGANLCSFSLSFVLYVLPLVIQLSRWGDWDPINLYVSSRHIFYLNFQCHISLSYYYSFCWYWWNWWPSQFKVSFVKVISAYSLSSENVDHNNLPQYIVRKIGRQQSQYICNPSCKRS